MRPPVSFRSYTPMLSAPSPLRSILTPGLIALAVVVARAEEPDQRPRTTPLVTADEFARLAERGLEVPGAGKYTVKVWAPSRQKWSAATEASALVLTSREEGDDQTPHWQVAGTIDVSGETLLKVSVRREEPSPTKPADPDQEKSKEKAAVAGKTTESRPTPVPALMILSTEAGFDPGPALEVVRGRTGTVAPHDDPRRTRSRTNQEGADFHAPATIDAWRDRAAQVREHMLVSLGLWPMFPRTPLHPQVRGKVERDGYTIEKVVLETLPGFTLSGNLYRPIGATGKIPALLCPHGHWKDGRVNPEVQQRCIRWAKLGCVVLMYDMVGYNDSKTFGHEFLNDRLRRWGLSLVTLQTWNSIRALDWLSSLPDVDPARIGCTGESGGGTQTFLLTALDHRIRVSAPVVMVSDSFQGGCVCENCAGLRHGTDNVEFAALTAPRPLKLVGATGDWTKLTMSNAYPAIRQVYELYGATHRISADVFDFPHNYNQTTRNAVYAFMAKWLLGIEDSERTREGEQTVEQPEDLWTFTDATPAPPNRKTPAQLENDLVQLLTWELDRLAPSTDSAQWQSARRFLATSHRVRVGVTNPPPSEVRPREIRRLNHRGATVIHSAIGRNKTGENIPVVRLIPRNATGRLTVVVSPHGKEVLTDPDGSFQPLVKALLERGQSVVAFDPLFVGESLDPSNPVRSRPATVHYETYNPALAADQMQDLATVVAWARAQTDVREISLVGQGRAGAQVLIARPALEGIARTAIDLHNFSEGDGSASLPAELDLPGLLQFGGLKSAAALVAPDPLWIYRAGDAFNGSWAENAYRLADSSHTLKLNQQQPSPDEVARWIDTGQ